MYLVPTGKTCATNEQTPRESKASTKDHGLTTPILCVHFPGEGGWMEGTGFVKRRSVSALYSNERKHANAPPEYSPPTDLPFESHGDRRFTPMLIAS